MLDATAVISRKRKDVQFILVVAPSRKVEEAKDMIDARVDAGELNSRLKIVHHETRDALAAADVAAVASGTATLEAALLETPRVIVYRESPINWHTLGRLITVEHYGLVNLVAGEQVATELMQNDLTGARLADELLRLLEPERNQKMREVLARVAHQLGEGGASEKAALAVLKEIKV
jgi:lipid-A-disaccharide synthase